MASSEARIQANRLNSLRSTGPKTAEGKEISRQNSFKHGLSGSGAVVASEDAEEVERRASALAADLNPRSPLGQVLVGQMAYLSVRMERAARQDLAASASRVRHAIANFDDARVDEAEQLFDELASNPRRVLRKLLRTPEGIDRVVEAWTDLRDDLTRQPKLIWDAGHLEMAANLLGISSGHARTSHLGALSRGLSGDFERLDDQADSSVDPSIRKAWAKDRLLELIDAELATLDELRETLDLEAIELDRREAPSRALFDASKEATLARRYEAEASRAFFKAMNEFRRVEAEFLARSSTLPPAETAEPLASSRAEVDRTPRDPIPAHPRPLPDDEKRLGAFNRTTFSNARPVLNTA